MIQDILDRLLATGRQLVESVIDWTPQLLLGVVLLVMALVLAKVVERVLRVILTRIRLDSLIQQAGIDQALQRLGLRQSLEQFLPRVAYFLLLFLFARTAADSLGLEAISQAFGSLLAYLPNVVAAVLILLLGSVAAQFAGTAVENAGKESGIEFASSLGTVVQALIFFVLAIMAVGQLKIDTEMVQLVTTGMLAAFAIAFGLSFGLGSRDITRNLLAGFYAKQTFEIGRPLQIGEEHGVLRSITATQVVLERDGEIVTFANSVFLDQMVRQSDG